MKLGWGLSTRGYKITFDLKSSTGSFCVGDLICSGLLPNCWYRISYILKDEEIQILFVYCVYNIVKQYDILNKNPLLWFIERMK